MLATMVCLGAGLVAPEVASAGVPMSAPMSAPAVRANADTDSPEYVYVSSRGPGGLSRIDTGAVPPAVADTKTLTGSPHGVAVTPDGKSVYVANNNGTVSVIDSKTYLVDETISVGGYLSALAMTIDGKRAYATDETGNLVAINTSTNRVTATISAQGKPQSVAVTDNGNRAFVTGYRWQPPHAPRGYFAVVNTSVDPPVVLTTAELGRSPSSVALNVDGSRAYIADPQTNTVSVIDTVTAGVLQSITVADGPRGTAVSVDGSRLYVTNSASDTVSVIDTATNTLSHTIKVGSGPTAVALTDDGTRAYVANASSISVIDTARRTVTSTVAVSNPAAIALGSTRRRTIISVGDSFISGVAGRWQGNGPGGNEAGDDWGTDRAAYNCDFDYTTCDHDDTRIYGTTANGGKGCLRADSAEIYGITASSVDRAINLACSGAETVNLKPAGSGGLWWKGEAPQGDQLRRFAHRSEVALVVVNIGGNDVGFRDIIKSCIKRFLFHYPGLDHCNRAQKETLENGLAATAPRLKEAIRAIRQVMTDAGYSGGDYRLVVQSYPNPVAPGDKNRYPESNVPRYRDGGCPVFNDDSDWVKDTVVPDLAQMIKKTAKDLNVDYLEVRNLFSGHEVCSTDAKQSTSANRAVGGNQGEWARFLDYRETQGGFVDESVHPNFYGQQALGACLDKVYDSARGEKNHTCTNKPGKSPWDVSLSSADW
ncbi:GDSL-type esterase/lipase family protein [Nonomuraea sp. NBC_01738]|uniref:hypothetical protein n=1 Tax=Nonomuraea sp. NBC_01738 TaxID=2976003 RepID=UPI002E106D48|nr:GDSL-type esterase/lipase family protein [Nonomuraea sp. NBC_01738]